MRGQDLLKHVLSGRVPKVIAGPDLRSGEPVGSIRLGKNNNLILFERTPLKHTLEREAVASSAMVADECHAVAAKFWSEPRPRGRTSQRDDRRLNAYQSNLVRDQRTSDLDPGLSADPPERRRVRTVPVDAALDGGRETRPLRSAICAGQEAHA